MVSVHPRLEELKKKRNNYRSLWICVLKILGQGKRMIIANSSFSKSPVYRGENENDEKSRRFQIPGKLPFRDGRVPNRRNIAAFSNSFRASVGRASVVHLRR